MRAGLLGENGDDEAGEEKGEFPFLGVVTDRTEEDDENFCGCRGVIRLQEFATVPVMCKRLKTCKFSSIDAFVTLPGFPAFRTCVRAGTQDFDAAVCVLYNRSNTDDDFDDGRRSSRLRDDSALDWEDVVDARYRGMFDFLFASFVNELAFCTSGEGALPPAMIAENDRASVLGTAASGAGVGGGEEKAGSPSAVMLAIFISVWVKTPEPVSGFVSGNSGVIMLQKPTKRKVWSPSAIQSKTIFLVTFWDLSAKSRQMLLVDHIE